MKKSVSKSDYSIDHMNAHICPDGVIRYEYPCSKCQPKKFCGNRKAVK